MHPFAVSPTTTTFDLPPPPAQADLASSSTTTSNDPTPLSPASARTHALLASFADLSPIRPAGSTDNDDDDDDDAREDQIASPSFLAQPFTPSAVLSHTQSFRPRQLKPRVSPLPASPEAFSAAADLSAPSPASKSAKAPTRRRRKSSAASPANPKFHSQPRSRRASYTPLSARSASFALSPRTPRSPADGPSSFPASTTTMSASAGTSSAHLPLVDVQPPGRSSLRHPDSSADDSSAASAAAIHKRSTPRKAPPPEIFILNATPASAAAGGRLFDLQRSPSTASAQSARSDWALSLGAFETLPPGYQLQPSPPTSPGVSPTTASFPAGGSGTTTPYGRVRSSRLNSASSLSIDRQVYSPPRTPLASARRRSYTSPMRQAQLRAGGPAPPIPQLPGKTTAKESKSNRQQRSTMPSEAPDKGQARREKERRKAAEQARPLPYSKKLEIDEFLGNLPAKPKKTRQPGSKDVAWRGEMSSRHVGSGRRTDHISEDGNVWIDEEDEQEWAWLLSEVGKGGQPLPHWPQHFTSHLTRSTSDSQRGRGLGPAGGRAAELEWTIQEIISETAYAADDGDLDAWIGEAPERLISVFNLKKDGTVRSASPTAKSDAGSDRSGGGGGKKRPRMLQVFGSTSSTSTVDRPTTPPLVASLDMQALQAHGKSDFLSSTFAPVSPSVSVATLPASPITPTDEPAMSTTKPRSNSFKSDKVAVSKPSKPTTGALGKMRGFLKKVGKDAPVAA